MGAHRRVISAAFSVESSAKVISLGQLASWADGTATSVSIARSVTAITLSTRMRDSFPDPGWRSDRRPADSGRDHVHAHHHRHDEQDHGGGFAIVEGPDRVPQVEADATAADHADHRGR